MGSFTKTRGLVFALVLLFTGLVALPASAVTIISQSANTDIFLGTPFNDLEFENPLSGNERVMNYAVLEWRDADYAAGPPRWYDDWTVSDPAGIDGNVNEIWMRRAGQSITTTVSSCETLSVHLTGDNNDGIAEILVDGDVVATLDMYNNSPPSQTALVIVKNLAPTAHAVQINARGAGQGGASDVATMGAAALELKFKWSQPPVPAEPDNVYYGWNETSIYNSHKIAADDWVCNTEDPVTDIHWWGSFIDWKEGYFPPTTPNSFHITIWTDVPAGVDKPYSHPGRVIWENRCDTDSVEMAFVGWDFDPLTESYEACFLFNYYLDEKDFFWQEPGGAAPNIYWVSIAAVYSDGIPTEYQWGWKTRPRDPRSQAPDAAVRIFDPTMPAMGSVFGAGEPIMALDKAWDLAFELTAQPVAFEPKWSQPPHPPKEGFDAASNFWWTGQLGPAMAKWEQLPDLDITGMDVDGTKDMEMLMSPQILADDFLCQSTGPIIDITVWSSWWKDMLPDGIAENVMFTLSLHADIPADQNPDGYSMPGDVLWLRQFAPGEFDVSVHADNLQEGWYSPCTEFYEPFGDTICWRYDFHIDPREAFIQQEGTIYWLDVQAQPMTPNPEIRWGWKTSLDHWNDDATWTVGEEPYIGSWMEMRYPKGHPLYPESVDLAFSITTQEAQEVNKVVADDFVSDGRPIEALRWWGSYLDDTYMPDRPVEPYVLDGWFISFHHMKPDGGPCPPDAVMGDSPTVLGVYFAPAEAVEIIPMGYPDCLGHMVYEYVVDFDQCCLICSEIDPRAGVAPRVPAQPGVFLESADFGYWLDIQAVVGVKWDPAVGCSYDDRVLTGHLPSPNTEDGHFWGWHTSLEYKMNEACTGRIMDLGPYPPNCWDYGQWNTQPWLCQQEPQPVNMSFELLTPGFSGEVYVKWSQQPEPYMPNDAIHGWDEFSIYDNEQIVADDWFCDTEMPVTDVHWWGSFIRWSEKEPPHMPDRFHIAIWTDVPEGQDEWYSHPGEVIWETDCDNFTWEFVGWDFDPRNSQAPPEACFKFEYDIPEEEWFHQAPGRNIYWVSIAAVYDEFPPDEYWWGWKTRPRDPESMAPDAAVMIWNPTSPHVGMQYSNGWPIDWPEEVFWDMAFELTTKKVPFQPKPPVPHVKWSQPPIEWDVTLPVPLYCGWDEMSYCPFGMPSKGGPISKVVADDFRCLGSMPITSVHWWGSHLDWREKEPPMDPPIMNWWVAFWSNTPADIDAPYSHPDKLLRQFVVSDERVEREWVGFDQFPDRPEDSCFQYYVNLELEEVFRQDEYETQDNVFWISIVAMYPEDAGYDIAFPWGWKTRPQHWMDDAVTFMSPLMPDLGMVIDPQSIDPLEHGQESYDVAFELDTDPDYIKWEQPFTGIRRWPHYEDEPSIAIATPYGEPRISRLVADNWICGARTPVTALAWWGSYLGYRYEACQDQIMPPPTKPEYFLLKIWTDDPRDTIPFGRPDQVVWEYASFDYDEVFVGYDKHPEDEVGPREPVFRYSVRLPEAEWFCQPNVNTVYWLSIVAVYNEDNIPEHPWGWTNHKKVLYEDNDDAVARGYDSTGQPQPWEELFDQTGVSEDMSFMLFTDPEICCSCADFFSDGIVDLNDLVVFVSNGHWLWTGPAGGYNTADLNCDGKVQLLDFAIFASQWLDSCP